MTSDSLILKYRPSKLEEVIGQDPVVKSLAEIVAKKRANAFCFVGPAGTGKTTLARIVADMMGANATEIIEVDAAKYNGIDEMRNLTDGLQYKPLRQGEVKALILNECHRLSANAWDSLLMSMEEPPPHARWFLTTTDAKKIPKAASTRCVRLELKPVPSHIMLELLLGPVAEIEEIKVSQKVLKLCAEEANGSPRQALSNLTLCSAAADEKEAAALLRTAVLSEGAIELARALMGAQSGWSQLMEAVAKMKDEDSESVRHVVNAYAAKVVGGAGSPQKAQRALAVLDAFSMPFNSTDGLAPLYLAVGRLFQVN